MRATAAFLLLAGGLVLGCGGDEPPAQPKRGMAPPPAGPGTAAQPPGPIVLKPKVEKRFRKEFTPEDFQADNSGEHNRDPFTSYLVAPLQVRQGPAVPDECMNRTVAPKFGFAELQLIGIVMRGTKNFAMFRDPEQFGQVAFLGDCLSKDKAKIIEITVGCVRLEIRGEAPPGSPAPPSHEELMCLHPDDLGIQ